jgi:negative regulator of flagellin synthesis FlgM
MMKIDNVGNPLSQMIQSFQKSENLNQTSDKAVDKQAAATTTAAASETVDISSRAKDIQLAQTAINSAPEIRADKVQELKTQIAQGTYEVNSGKVAMKMVGESLMDIFSR